MKKKRNPKTEQSNPSQYIENISKTCLTNLRLRLKIGEKKGERNDTYK